jgi:hypothetical protein
MLSFLFILISIDLSPTAWKMGFARLDISRMAYFG